MGFFKSLVSQKESALYTVDTQIGLYNKYRTTSPMSEPHEVLFWVYKSYVTTRNIYKGQSAEWIEQQSLIDTIKIAAIPTDSQRSKALALLLLWRSEETDGGQLNAYPNYLNEYSSLTDQIESLYKDHRSEFWKLYITYNPEMYKIYKELYKKIDEDWTFEENHPKMLSNSDTLPRDSRGLDKQRDRHFKVIKADNKELDIYSKICSAWLVSRATELVEEKRFDDANRDCLEAISLAPDDVMPQIKLAVVAYYQGKFQESINILEMAPKKTKDILGHEEDNRFIILFNMGLIYGKTGEDEKAISCFKIALKLPKIITEFDKIVAESQNRTAGEEDSEEREIMETMIRLYEDENKQDHK